MTYTKRTVNVPGALREPFRKFLDAAPGTPERDAAIGAWDALEWRGTGGKSLGAPSSSAKMTVTPEQAAYLAARLREFLKADGTMLVRPQARKLRDRLEAPRHFSEK
ncbi:hypothetical protein ABZS76_32890 [Streptomyces sp. NPDC005562]|uniref:hypothetical protein n=1 Tax=Streptomyces sp. NPDC005562 TaxID=3154890 RepID=UPI0033A7B419